MLPLLLSVSLATLDTPSWKVQPTISTQSVPSDADDPAIWVHPTSPGKSLVLGTDKIEKTGGLYVFDLNGKIVQKFTGMDRPNNVDVEPGFMLNGKLVDLAVVSERKQKRLRIFAIDRETGRLNDVTGETRVFAESTGAESEPMGITLYKRASDQSVFAVVAPKTGPNLGYLGQYLLIANGGKVDLQFVRRFGEFSGLNAEGEGEIEALAVDDARGVIAYSDELFGIRWARVDPFSADSSGFSFGREGYLEDREGLAFVSNGFFLSTDQVENGSRVYVYPRSLHAGVKPIHRVDTPSDSTDGLDATATPLGAKFPRGMVVMMDSKNRRFQMYRLEQFLPPQSRL
ncbi:MAG: phytase [Armatimonadetes bacterium]|nr:phytase [Armatimonadota bacterium]